MGATKVDTRSLDYSSCRCLHNPLVPFFPCIFGFSLLELNIWRKGTLIKLGNLVYDSEHEGPRFLVGLWYKVPQIGLNDIGDYLGA